MKIVYRVFYSFFVVIMFLAMNNLAKQIVTNGYFKEAAKNWDKKESPKNYIDIYGATGFHKKEATYVIKENDYNIYFYEINKVFTKKNSPLLVEEYFYIIIDHPSKVMPVEYPHRYYVRLNNENDDVIAFKIQQFKSFPFSVVVDERENGLIDVYDFFEHEYTKIEIFEFEEESDDVVLMSTEISLNESYLTMKEYLRQDYKDKEMLKDNGIYYKTDALAGKYATRYVLIMVGYLVLVVLATYMFFIYRKRIMRPNR